MQRWESVARHYAQINPEPARSLSASVLSRLQTWLEDDVVPLLGEVTRLPRFRELATFSLRTLAIGTNSDQRRAVERVDRSLIEAAQAILAVVDHRQAMARLRSLQTQRPSDVCGVVEVGNDINRTTPAISTTESALPNTDALDFQIAAVRIVARRDWDDLVCPEDFFSTRQEFVRRDDGSRLQRGEMINSLNLRLLPIGDLVARSLRRRIDVRVGVIHALACRIHHVQADPELCSLVELTRWSHAEQELDEATRRLEALSFVDSDATLRDSCVVLSQVYASMHPEAELEWLGLCEELVSEARGRLASLLRGHRGNAIHDRIARAVQDMGQLYRGLDPNISQLEMAIATGGLVIYEPTQSAWWEGSLIEFGSGTKHMEFLATLARKACSRQAVTEADLYDDTPSDSAMANRWSRLGPALPSSLTMLIRPGTSPRTYQLSLERHRIFLIRSL